MISEKVCYQSAAVHFEWSDFLFSGNIVSKSSFGVNQTFKAQGQAPGIAPNAGIAPAASKGEVILADSSSGPQGLGS